MWRIRQRGQTHGRELRSSLFAAFLLAVVGLGACVQQPEYPVVRLHIEEASDVVEVTPEQPRAPLRVAVAAVISPRATFDVYGPLLTYLAHALGRPVELIQRPTYAEINDLVRTGRADVAFVCSGSFVEGERDGYMELLVIPEMNGERVYYALILVPTDSPVRAFEDLRGRRFAFTDPLSNSGHLYVQYRLRQMGETEERFFSETIFTYGHDNSIRAVADTLVDGATVDSLVFEALMREEPELATRVRVVEQSPPFGIPPVVVHPELEPELRQALETALLTMHETPEGREAWAVLGIDRFVLPQPELYASVREMAAKVRGWRETQTATTGSRAP